MTKEKNKKSQTISHVDEKSDEEIEQYWDTGKTDSAVPIPLPQPRDEDMSSDSRNAGNSQDSAEEGASSDE